MVKANIEIVRSNKHSMPVSYVDVGTDAAVAYDYKDLIFKNNTDYPIFLEGRVSGNSVVFSIYGYPLEEGTEIEIVTDVYETIEPEEPKIILDTEGEHVTYTDETKVKKKARDGIKVRSYRVIKKDGEEVSRELLRDDYYKEVQGEIYQGVTLGALSLRAGQKLKGTKRHPTIEDDVTIYSGASVLGGDTVIGEGSVIAGNTFVTESVPPHSRVLLKNQDVIVK